MQQKKLNSVLPGLALLRTGSPSSIEYANMRKTSTFQASYFNSIVELWNYVSKLAPPTSFFSPTASQRFVRKSMSTHLSKSITPACGHQSLRAHATRNLLLFFCTNVQVFILFYFNLGLNLGAVPRMGRQSRCTYPVWVFASFLFLCVLYYKLILCITRGVPNKAVEKKCVTCVRCNF